MSEQIGEVWGQLRRTKAVLRHVLAISIGARLILFFLVLAHCGCADKHALQVGVTYRYPDGPTFDQGTHGRVQKADNPYPLGRMAREAWEAAADRGLVGDIWLLPDGGVEIR